MDAIEKALKRLLVLSIAFSVMFAAGIPLIPVGASKGLWALMIVGIVFTAAGFYGTPMLWTAYGARRGLRRLVYAVTKEHLLTVTELASQLGKSEKNVRSMLTDCFNRGYLVGYVRKGDELAPNEAQSPFEKLHAAEFTYKGADAVCPYCGAMNEEKR